MRANSLESKLGRAVKHIALFTLRRVRGVLPILELAINLFQIAPGIHLRSVTRKNIRAETADTLRGDGSIYRKLRRTARRAWIVAICVMQLFIPM